MRRLMTEGALPSANSIIQMVGGRSHGAGESTRTALRPRGPSQRNCTDERLDRAAPQRFICEKYLRNDFNGPSNRVHFEILFD